MASYAWPSDIGIADFKIELLQNRAVFESIFTGQKQVVALNAGAADRWQGVITTAKLSNYDAQKILAYLSRVGLYNNYMLLPHPDYAGPRDGSSSGTVGSAGQTGTSLSGSWSGPYYAGEYFEVNNEFKILTQDYSGGGTINFAPALHASPPGSASVDFGTPQIRAWLTAAPMMSTDDLKFGTATVAFEEVI
jgi:hypothetical protein